MGAGAYVGRIGGLAVALGIGAAVFLGHGVASADASNDSGSAGSDSGSTSSAGSNNSSTTGSSSPNKIKKPSDKDQTAAEKSTADSTGATSSTGRSHTKTADPSESTSTADPSPITSTVDDTSKKRKKPDSSTPSSRTAGDATSTSGSTDSKTAQPGTAGATASDATAPPHPASPKKAAPETAHEPTVTNTAAPTAVSPVASVDVASATTAPAVTVAPPPSAAPADTVASAISEVVGAVLSPFAGTSPTAPTESPLPWIAMAAARKELGATAATARVVAPVTASAPVDPTPALSAAVTAAANVTTPAVIAPPTNVVAIPQISLVTALGLQNLPIIGPLFVTPIVAFVNAIPIVSDLLHPIFGYPLQAGLPAGSPQPEDVRVVSFDGTQINVHFMPATGLLAGQQAPTILDGPGLGEPGATNLNGTPLDGILQDNLGVVGIATLRNAGYNVVTWDPRGEYFSGGVLELDSPDYEARDVSSIISWVAQQPEAELDGPNDPRLGMVGVSYGGGIQLVSAAIDHRIDAIVPTIAWNTLNDALYPNQAFKTGWGTLLTAALLATFARPDPAVYPAAIYGDLTSTLTQAQQDLLSARGPGDLVSQITAPTLLFQGTVDTLFPLEEANLNATALIAAGVPTKVVWFCGGHGLCVNDPLDSRDGVVIEEDTLAWLNRYVKGVATVSTGPQFQWVDQHGQYYSSNVYPVPTGTPIVTTSSASSVLPLVPLIGGSGPLLGVLPIGGTKAFNAINLTIPAATATTYVVGAPQLTLTYSGTGTSRFVYAQLVDDSTGLVLGNQVTPIPVTLNGQTQTISAPLNMVAATLTPGQTVTLQLVATSADFESITSLGQLTVSSMTLSLPTANPAAVAVTTVA